MITYNLILHMYFVRTIGDQAVQHEVSPTEYHILDIC